MSKPGHSSRHGHTSSTGGVKRMTPTYRVWNMMLDRCTNPKSDSYAAYGGAGIAVCSRWHDFANFLADMGARPEGMTLDRMRAGDGYQPNNCRWATRGEQARNRKTNHYVTYAGRTMCLSDWSLETGIHKATLRHRLMRGWSVERALTP